MEPMLVDVSGDGLKDIVYLASCPSFSASALYPIRKMEVWIDGAKRSETYNTVGEQAFANPSLSLSAGTHKVSLFSGAYDGSVQKTSYSITVR